MANPNFWNPPPTTTGEDFWEDGDFDPATSYTGALPVGYSLAEVQDYLRRNPGATQEQVIAALSDRLPGHGMPESSVSAAPFGQAAPQSIQPFTEQFTAPTMQQAQQSPGFQFRLGEGLKALQRSAAAKGTLLTGGTLKSLTDYAGDSASGEYDKIYDRAMGEYGTKFGVHQWNEGSRFSSQRTNRMDDYGIFSGDREFGRGLDNDWYYRRFKLAELGYNAARNPA